MATVVRLQSREDETLGHWSHACDVTRKRVGKGVLTKRCFSARLETFLSQSDLSWQDHKDREWKFARSKLWMGYFDEGSTLPPPFNLIISPKSVWYFCRCLLRVLRYICKWPSKKRPRFDHSAVKPEATNPTFVGDFSDKGSTKPPRDGALFPVHLAAQRSKVQYQEVMKRLVNRYIHRAKKQLRQDGVSEDDLLEIKQDISSLRFELREDRKREAAHNVSQLNALRRDILRGTGSGVGSPTYLEVPSHVPSPPLAAHHPGTPPMMIYGGILTPEELAQLRSQIVSGVREEIRNLARELHFQHCQRPHQVASYVAPREARRPAPADLFQTHLYTQL